MTFENPEPFDTLPRFSVEVPRFMLGAFWISVGLSLGSLLHSDDTLIDGLRQMVEMHLLKVRLFF